MARHPDSSSPDDHAALDEEVQFRNQVAAQRTRFFGYLALLSGGAILLSVSLVSGALGKGLLSAITVLYAGWLALLIALFGSLFRALIHQPAPKMRQTAIPMVRPLPLAHRAGDTVIEEEEEAARPVTGQHNRHVRISEAFAIHGFWMGTVLLVIFAGYNVAAAHQQAIPATPVTENYSERLFAPPDVSEGSSRAASCAEATRVAAACTQSGINTEAVEPFASKGGYQIPLPPIADVPRGFRPDPNPKDCDTAEQWQNYCRAHP